MKVYISPSGQEYNKYAYGNHTEAEICRKIAYTVSEELSKRKIENQVAMPYKSDSEFNTRITQSDAMKADYHVAIHTNAGGGHGVRIFVYSNEDIDDTVNAVFKNLYLILPHEFRQGSISVNRQLIEVNAPLARTIYIEVAFHDNEKEAKWLVENTKLIGETIAKSFPSTEQQALYKIQVGAFKNKVNAESYLRELKKKGIEGFIVNV